MYAMEENDRPEAPKDEPNALTKGLKYVHIGFVIPGATIAGWLLGAMLDRWLGTNWIYLVGLGLGVITGFYDLIRTVIRMSKEQ